MKGFAREGVTQVSCKNPVCYRRDVPTTIPEDGMCCPYCGNSYGRHGVDLRESLKAREAEEKARQAYAANVLKGNEAGLTILVAGFAAIALLGTLLISRRAGKKFPLEKDRVVENNPTWCANRACRSFGRPVHASLPEQCCPDCGNAYAPKSK